MWITIILFVLWIVGIAIDISTETDKDIRYHKGGFLGLGYTTCSKRNTTTHDVRWAMLWPLRLIKWSTLIFIWICHDLYAVILLAFGIQYKYSKKYKKIDKWFSEKV